MSGISAVPWKPPFPNAQFLQVRDLGGTARDALGVTAGDNLVIGNGSLPTILQGAAFAQNVTNLQLKPYVSANQGISLGSWASLAHGLGARPSLVMLSLVCVSAQYGYTAGDEITNTGDTYGRNIECSADATNVYISYPATAPQINTKTGGAGGVITVPGNWSCKVRAWP